MTRYKKRPVEIEAVKFNRNNFQEVKEFTNNTAHSLIIEKRIDGIATCVIPTLEGQHLATEGDYIIKGIAGEFYPCKNEIFLKTYDKVEEINLANVKTKRFEMEDGMDFGKALNALKEGKRVARKGWNGKGLFVFKQVPANVGIQYVPNMQSLPQSVKDEFGKRGENLNYSNQMCIVKSDNTIDSWVPSSSDVFAEDWIVLE
jgi:hypothetical protein